jgi:hypothetical protein
MIFSNVVGIILAITLSLGIVVGAFADTPLAMAASSSSSLHNKKQVTLQQYLMT